MNMDSFRDILEIIYFISGPLLVLIAYGALSQIKVAKEQLEEQRKFSQIASKRDALKVTSEQITSYGSDIVPLQNIYHKKIESEEIKYFSKSTVEVNGNEIRMEPCKDKAEFKKLELILEEYTNVLNRMEGFSVFFMSGVADEKIAYLSLSDTFCTFVKEAMPLLLLLDPDKNRFTATTSLFFTWNSRLESESLKKQKELLDKKIKNNQPQTVKFVGENA